MNEFSSSAVVSEVLSPEIQRVAEFAQKVEGAAAFIQAAHPTQKSVKALLRVSHHGKVVRKRSGHSTWYKFLVSACTDRAMDIIAVIEKHPAIGQAIVAERTAFGLLSELTPVSTHLNELLVRDRIVACRRLSDQVILICTQFDKAGEIVEFPIEDKAKPISFAAESKALLKTAGGSFSLTEASESLHISRQALHKRIAKGTVLGMMVDDEIRVPKLQIIVGKSAKAEATILDGIERAVKPFIDSKAGPWAALQFLTETDPNLRSTPLSALKAGKIEAAEQAARSHLGLDEG